MATPTPMFIPSSWRLDRMIEAAEAKFAAAREAALWERAESAFAYNRRVISEGRKSDALRYRRAGDRP